jgi:hypothetical protein
MGEFFGDGCAEVTGFVKYFKMLHMHINSHTYTQANFTNVSLQST